MTDEEEFEKELEEERELILEEGEAEATRTEEAGDAVGGAASLAGPEGAAAGALATLAAREKAARQRAAAKKKAAKKKPGLFHRAKKHYDNANEAFMRAQENAQAAVVNTAVAFDRGLHPWLFFLAALFFHAWDALHGFDRGGQNFLLMFTVYGLFALYAALGYYRTGLTRDSMRYFGISIFAFLIPFIFQLPVVGPFLSRLPLLLTILTFTPVWALYIALKEESGPLHTIGKWWTTAIVIALFIIALAMVSLPSALGTLHPVQLGQSLRTTWTQLQDSWLTVKDRFGVIFNVREWRQRINQTFNPYMAYYSGQVEQNKREPLGVYITRLDPLYPKTFVNTSPLIQGRIEAKSFLDKDVLITPSCRLERAGKEAWAGTPDVKEPLRLNYQLIRDVVCKFPPIPNAGTYTAVMGASFNFETWAYITETFVSRDTIEQYSAQRQDVNTALDIPRTATAVYTNGPVMLGVSADEQPLDIDPEAREPLQRRFGFTLDNRWNQGEIGEVESIDVLVPEPFKLEECYPVEPTSKQEAEQGGAVTRYTFTKGIQTDARYNYRSVTCKLALPSKQAAEEVLAFGEKTPVTFVVIARYTYQLEKKTRVRVVR